VSEPERRETGAGEVRNEIEHARATGDVVQARDVSGGVHFHASESGSPGQRVIPRQLPTDVSAFINRRPELSALTRLVGRTDRQAQTTRSMAAAVVVITGSAGVGKTALCLHWAHLVRDRFPDGELYANLRGYDDSPPVTAEVVLDRFLRDLGVAPQSVPTDLDGRAALFRSLITERRILIVLDNAADVGQVRPLLPGGHGPLVIITSRNQLPGLAIRDGAQRIRLDIFQESDAVALLRRVTRTGGRRDAPDDLTELAQLCARLPLALRVAAEHAISRPTMQLAELISDLRDDSMLWDALSVGQGPHSEAVRTVFAWSYRDLPPEAARMFRALGLHQGPDISLPVAAAAAQVPARTARRALDILLGAFLVQTVRPQRYQLHDLLRAYALDQARATDSEADRQATLDQMLRWYIVTANQACLLLSPGDRFQVDVSPPDGPEATTFENTAAAFEWFDSERPNLVANARAALAAGLPQRAWELAMVLSPMHAQYFTFDDWSVLSETAVTAAEAIGDQESLAAALTSRGQLLFRRRALAEAKATHTRVLAIYEEIGTQRGICQSLNALGLVSLRTRELAEAIAYFADTAERARRVGDAYWEGLARMNLAEAQLEAGDVRRALATITPLPQFFADQHEPGYQGNALWLLSWAHRLAGNLPAALNAIDAALRIAENASNRMWEAFWLIEAARIHLASGNSAEAMRCCRMSASLERQIGDPSREAAALDCAGEVLQATGNAEDAAAFHQQAARMHQQLGDHWQEALATMHLAECEQSLGQADASRDHIEAALALLQQFPDARAARLRAGLAARLTLVSRRAGHPQRAIGALYPDATVRRQAGLLRPDIPALDRHDRSFAVVEVAQHPDLVMHAQPGALPGDFVPLGRRKPGIRRHRLILRYPRITVHRGVKSLHEQSGQHLLGEIPYVRSGYLVRNRQIINLCQDWTSVDPLGHAVHGDPNRGIAVADNPRDRRWPAVLRQCRRMHVQRAEPRQC
jgi:tetratricopeptide (TPR) repeat protein